MLQRIYHEKPIKRYAFPWNGGVVLLIAAAVVAGAVVTVTAAVGVPLKLSHRKKKSLIGKHVKSVDTSQAPTPGMPNNPT